VRARLWRGAALALIALGLVTLRVLWSSHGEWREAERCLAENDASMAVDHFGRAARLYAPGSPWVERSLGRLEEMALGAEAHKDDSLALMAWRELRSSVLATRSFYTPHPAALERANHHIARLTARNEPPAVAPGAKLEVRERWHAARLGQDDAPSVLWAVLALLGLMGWIGAAIGFLLRGIDEEARLRKDAAIGWALGIVAGLGLFLIALGRA
jgi:hypothetical protein